MLAYFLFFLMVAVSVADSLPNYAKSPWYKTYHGYHYRNADVVLNTDGEIYLYPLNGKKRVPVSKAVKIRVVVEYRDSDQHSWIKRKHKPRAYQFTEAAAVQREKSEIIATVTGGVKYQLNLQFDKKGVSIGGSFVELPKKKKGQHRLIVYAEIPDLYNLVANGKVSKTREKLRGDSATLESLDSRNSDKRYRLNQWVKPKELADFKLKSFKLKAKRYGKSDLTWGLVDEEKGELELILRYEGQGLHKGFAIQTVLVDEAKKAQSTGMRINIR